MNIDPLQPDALSGPNAGRRHETPSQIAAALVVLHKWERGGDRGNQHTGGKGSREPLPTQQQAADEAGIGRETIKRAAKVAEKAPEVLPSVRDGKLDATTAAKVADLTPKQREKAGVPSGNFPQGEVGKTRDKVGELVSLGKELEAIERPKAKDRKTAGVNQHTEPEGKFPQSSTGKTADKVGEALGTNQHKKKAKEGVSRDTFSKTQREPRLIEVETAAGETHQVRICAPAHPTREDSANCAIAQLEPPPMRRLRSANADLERPVSMPLQLRMSAVAGGFLRSFQVRIYEPDRRSKSGDEVRISEPEGTENQPPQVRDHAPETPTVTRPQVGKSPTEPGDIQTDSTAINRSSHAVRRCLELRPKWSDGKLADFIGVSRQFVSDNRPQVATVATSDPEKREGKDGKEYPAAKPKPKPEQPVASDEPGPELSPAECVDDPHQPRMYEVDAAGKRDGEDGKLRSAAAPDGAIDRTGNKSPSEQKRNALKPSWHAFPVVRATGWGLLP